MVKEKIIELWKQGYSYRDIANQVNEDEKTLYWDNERVRDVVRKYRKSQENKPVVDKPQSILNNPTIQLQKEKVQIRDERNLLNKTIRDYARFENLTEKLIDAIKESNLQPFKSNNIPIKKSDNKKFMVVSFADWHYAAEFDNYWGKYNQEIFENRLQRYIQRIIEVGELHKINDVSVIGLGDFISGIIHLNLRVTNEKDVITQTQEVSEYVANALFEISKYFNKVDFHTVIGNHARISANKDESLYTENFERFIPWYLKTRLRDVKNIEICDSNIDDGIVAFNKNGQLIVASHGDKDGLKNCVADLTLMLGEIPTAVYTAHLHHASSDTVQGVKIIMSGTLEGTDDHSKNIRKTGFASQAITIHDENGVECIYDINFNQLTER